METEQITNSSIYLKNVSASSSGRYKCEVTARKSKIQIKSAHVDLNVGTVQLDRVT